MVKYFIDGEPRYLVGNESLTQEAFDKIKSKTYEKDFEAGYRDRKAHYYDKWYRYNREDEGKAYDDGVQACVKESHDIKWFLEDENFHIIECVEAKLIMTSEGIKDEYFINKEKVH